MKTTGRYKFALETIVRLENKIAKLESNREAWCRLQIEKDREDACNDIDYSNGCYAGGSYCDHDGIRNQIKNRPIKL